jgi:hypothetical protein
MDTEGMINTVAEIDDLERTPRDELPQITSGVLNEIGRLRDLVERRDDHLSRLDILGLLTPEELLRERATITQDRRAALDWARGRIDDLIARDLIPEPLVRSWQSRREGFRRVHARTRPV